MTLKTLLLGSATAFAVVGGAQAADLSVAEPVDYVRVCDAFGTGFWYIPGTDTCLAIHGYVQMDINMHPRGVVLGGNEDNLGDSGPPVGKDHYSTYDYNTEAGVNFTSKSMTEFGELTSFVDIRGNFNNSTSAQYETENTTNGHEGETRFSTQGITHLDSAYLQLGALLAGHTASTFDYGGKFDTGVTDTGLFAGRSDTKTDQIRLSWAMSGFGIMLGIEDPRDRWGTGLPGVTKYGSNDGDVSMPDIIGAVTMSQANWDAKLSVGVASTAPDMAPGPDPVVTGFGLQGGITFKLDSIAQGDQLRLLGAWSNNASSFVGGTAPTGNSWSVLGSFQHFWTPQLSTAITGTYISDPGCDGFGGCGYNKVYTASGDLVWAPVAGFTAAIAGQYYNSNGTGTVRARLRLKRSF